jgi:hypothetical protein
MTAKTTNFDEFLDSMDFDNHEEIMELYNTAKDLEDNFMFQSELINLGPGKIVKCSYPKITLVLTTEKATEAFLREIENRYCDGLDIESWYGMQVAMASDNS